MERTVYQRLLEWKGSSVRKPLVLLGARQVGKTYILKEFGRNEFKNIVYINCDNNSFTDTLFRDFDIQRIIHAIEVNYEVKVEIGQTLIFFDEIQEAKGGVASLKYFCEDMHDLHVVAAGSLLGLALREDENFPVGKVNTIKMYPMTFTEFKGAFTESYFLQELVGIGGIPAYYYSKDNSTLEIEFLVQYDGQVFPCEVKAEQNVKAKSLRTFVANEFPELRSTYGRLPPEGRKNLHGLRFSMLPYADQGWMENYPLSGIAGRFHPQEED
ncbi:ATP-binding protein [Xylanibacter ruminicola]|uniref:ATP-binding protein n=1 Tax=Xylanibacter ruminicola TaxID=839 RepID=UPI00048AC200|nr:ATP-binding protein [Xylanibacter ruminicola]